MKLIIGNIQIDKFIVNESKGLMDMSIGGKAYARFILDQSYYYTITHNKCVIYGEVFIDRKGKLKWISMNIQ